MSHLSELAQRYYQAFNRRDWAVYPSLFTPDAEIVVNGVTTKGGVEAMLAFDRMWTEAAPDARVVELRKAEAPGLVICENRFTGTHTAPLVTPVGTLPPLGRRIDEPYVGAFDVAGERLRVQRIYYDHHTLLRVIGAI